MLISEHKWQHTGSVVAGPSYDSTF